jgi:hypothetical protein
MTNNDINYKQVLDDLKTRRAKLDAAISAIEEIVGTVLPSNLPTFRLQPDQNAPVGHSAAAVGITDADIAVVTGPYTGKTIIAATTEYLKSVGRAQHITTIIDALTKGGLHTNSKSLYRTVYNTLTTNLEKGLVRNDQNVWGLKEWRDGPK